jgi:hypothetical protein
MATGVLMLGLGACGGGAHKPAPTTIPTTAEVHTLTGTLDVYDPFSGGYSDIDTGGQVAVTNAAGTLIGTGTIDSVNLGSNVATYHFTVPNLPRSDWCRVNIGHRNPMSCTYGELEGQGWNIGLTLGSPSDATDTTTF